MLKKNKKEVNMKLQSVQVSPFQFDSLIKKKIGYEIKRPADEAVFSGGKCLKIVDQKGNRECYVQVGSLIYDRAVNDVYLYVNLQITRKASA